MTICATKRTMKRYGLQDELHQDGNVVPIWAGLEHSNPLQQWGANSICSGQTDMMALQESDPEFVFI